MYVEGGNVVTSVWVIVPGDGVDAAWVETTVTFCIETERLVTWILVVSVTAGCVETTVDTTKLV